MTRDTVEVVQQMRDYAVRYPRTSTVDREIGEYQVEVEGVLVTYFHTANKTVLSLARARKAPSRAQVERFRKMFDVPAWAMVERPSHPLYGIVRLKWRRLVKLAFL